MASLLWDPGRARSPRAGPSTPRPLRPALLCPQYNKHLFVHIGQSSPSYSDPYLEAVDIHQIYDKFPEKKGGLKELFERGPSNAFFLVKFWVSLWWPLPSCPSSTMTITWPLAQLPRGKSLTREAWLAGGTDGNPALVRGDSSVGALLTSTCLLPVGDNSLCSSSHPQMRTTLDPHFTDGETEAWSQQGPGWETPSPGEPGSCSPSCDGCAGEDQGRQEKVTLIVLL